MPLSFPGDDEASDHSATCPHCGWEGHPDSIARRECCTIALQSSPETADSATVTAWNAVTALNKAKEFINTNGSVIVLEAMAQFLEEASHEGGFTPAERSAFAFRARLIRAMQDHPTPSIIKR